MYLRWRTAGLALAAALAVLLLVEAPPLSAEGAAEKDVPGLDGLSWMVGHWSGTVGDTVSEEWWTPAAGGVMLGLHRDVRGNKPTFFEFLRIAESEGQLVFIAQPLGREATEFRLVEFDNQSVAFENLQHDYPQRIIYSVDAAGRLVARIEGETSSGPASSEWRWSRVE